MKKPHIQDLRAALRINSDVIECNHGYCPGFRWLRALPSFSGVKGPGILSPSGVGIFHRSDTLLMSLSDTRSLTLCAPFFISYEAMEFAETGHRQEECLNLPVSLLIGSAPCG